MQWSELARRQPQLEQCARELLIAPGVMLVATIRKDGTPRISPVEPLIVDDDLWLSMLHGSAKAKDLLRDPRLLVHSIVTNRDGEQGELKIRGTAIANEDAVMHAHYAETANAKLGWRPEVGHFHLFQVAIDSVVFMRYEDGDQYLTSWPPAREQMRRKLTATSLHPPERTRQLLVDESDGAGQ